MRHYLRRSGMLAILALILSGFSLAQEFAYRVAANIPVDFYVGDQHMAAGNYLFAINYENHAVTIENQSTGEHSVVLASPVTLASPGYTRRDKATTVQLDSVNGKYVLADVITRTNDVTFLEAHANGGLASSEDNLTIVASLR
jgi:hypothetical protein